MLTEEGIGSFMKRHQQWCLFLCVSIPSSARAAGTFSQWEKVVVRCGLSRKRLPLLPMGGAVSGC